MEKTKEEEKYYTPKIEEFHVGFEYERINNLYYSGNSLSKGEWVKDELSDTDLSDMEYIINHEEVRVKHLDRDDIESLNWKFHEYWISEEDGSIYLNNFYGLTVFNKTRTISIWERVQGDIEGETYFSGTIRNKSELKRILAQIGI